MRRSIGPARSTTAILAIAARDVEIPVTYEVERETVRAIRGDGRGEHRIELLPDDRIRVELPIGVTAVYRRTGS